MRAAERMRKNLLLIAMAAISMAGCSSGAANARKKIREVHVPEVRKMIESDIVKHIGGVQKAALKIAPGFRVEDPETRMKQLRVGLKYLHEPPRGVQELIASPLTFLAAIGKDGMLITRDVEPDPLRGENFAEKYEVVRNALDKGITGYAVVEVGSEITIANDAPSPEFLVFVAPSQLEGETVGAVMVGIPLWRLEQRISRQLQLDNTREKGGVFWSYVYHGQALYAQVGAHPDLDTIIPKAADRAAKLESSPHGFTAEAEQYGRWYAFGIWPAPVLGENIGVLIVRSDPP